MARSRAPCLAIAIALGEDPQASDRFALAWEAPAGCPDAAFARARVERFLGRPVGGANDPEVHARVVLGNREGLFVASITFDENAARELTAERCDVVADAAAYVVAAWIDPTVLPPEPDAPMADPVPPPAVAPPPTTPITPPKPKPKPKTPRVRAAIRVGGGVGVGPLPRVGPAFAGAGALLLRRLRFELGVSHWLARPARVADRGGGDIRLTTGAARICPLAVVRPIEVPLCAGFELGSMHGTAVGIDQPANVRLLWAAFTASAGITWMPSRFVGAWVDATLAVPVSRPVFEAENIGRIHRPAAVGFAGMLGVEARFP